jgi:LysR family cyn operon transcriptional activator
VKLNRIDLNKLYTFTAVAESGGISKAAARLGLTRSAISQSVSALEASLGLRLFHRVGRRLLLAPPGEELFARAVDYQRGLESALDALVSHPEEARGVVRVGLFIGFSRARLTDFLAVFLERNPGVQIRLLFVSQPELASLLTENKIDLALSIYPLSSEARLIQSRRLFQEELVLVSGKRHFIANPTLAQVQRLPMIDYYQSGQVARTWVRHHFGGAPKPLNIRAFGAAVDFVLELILKGAGAGIVPKSVAENELRRKRLFQIRTGKPELTDSVWLNELRRFEHSPAVRLFREKLREEFRAELPEAKNPL